MIQTSVSSARALVADRRAVYRLLEDVPQNGELQGALTRPFFGRRWQQSTQRSFWIGSDGTTAVCVTVRGLSADETVAIWVSFEDYQRRAGFKLSARTMGEVIEAELGIKVEQTS